MTKHSCYPSAHLARTLRRFTPSARTLRQHTRACHPGTQVTTYKSCAAAKTNSKSASHHTPRAATAPPPPHIRIIVGLVLTVCARRRPAWTHASEVDGNVRYCELPEPLKEKPRGA